MTYLKPLSNINLHTITLLTVTLFLLTACSKEADKPTAPVTHGSPAALNDQPEKLFPAGEEGQLPEIDHKALQTLIDQTSADGKVLVIDFWATWCVPCVEMFPKIHQGLQPLIDQGKARLVTVSFDASSEPYMSRAIDFLRKNHALHDAYIAPTSPMQESIVDALGQDWKDLVVPAILIYNKQGNLAAEYLQGGVDQQVIQTTTELANQPS